MKTLYIKNMVCRRCKTAVINELKDLDILPLEVTLGEVRLEKEISEGQRKEIAHRLEKLGFELFEDKKSRLIEQIKATIIELIHEEKGDIQTNLSDFISHKLSYEYNYLSAVFSEVEGRTIEKYFIAQRIEKVKELLVYDELTLNEIALKLGYSSPAYLSNQFKKVTGLTPSFFKRMRVIKRKPLDEV